MFFFWKEFLGKNLFLSGYMFILSVWCLMPSVWYCRRDSRKAVFLQHGVFDTSMGWVFSSFSFLVNVIFPSVKLVQFPAIVGRSAPKNHVVIEVISFRCLGEECTFFILMCFCIFNFIWRSRFSQGGVRKIGGSLWKYEFEPTFEYLKLLKYLHRFGLDY